MSRRIAPTTMLVGLKGPANEWLSGTTVPAAGLGRIGQPYLRTTTGDIYIKTDAGWGTPVANNTGPEGPIGPVGLQGLPGPGSAAWTAAQAVTVGSVRQAPDGTIIKSTAARTTGASFDATEQTFWTPVSAYPGTLEQLSQTATIEAAFEAPTVLTYDPYAGPLFDGGLNKFVTGQNVATLATTAAVSAGATVLPLNSVTNVTAGVCLITDYGTADQQVHRVVSVAGNDATVAHPVLHPLSSGEVVASFWNNASHVTTGAGMLAVAYDTMNAQDDSGNYLITGTAPKVTVLGNSWPATIAGNYATYLQARIPGATVVNAGIGGNTTAQMLARFDTDVPADSDYVVLFEWVNDTYQAVSPADQALHWEQLVDKVLAIGAVPIVVGPVPLSDYATYSANQETAFLAQFVGNGRTYPATSMKANAAAFGNAGYIVKPNSTSIGLGGGTLAAVPSGGANVALGGNAGNKLTTGLNNTVAGYNALLNCTTGQFHTAIGNAALATITGGISNVAVGTNALFSAVTSSNVAVGKDAGYSPAGVVGNATTTGQQNTFVGYQSGGVAASSKGTALGWQAITGAINATAVGAGATATAAGAVAIGIDNAGTAAASATINDFVLGTALHTVKTPGVLVPAASTTTKAGLRLSHGAAPTSPTNGDIWSTTAGLFIQINGVTKTVTLT